MSSCKTSMESETRMADLDDVISATAEAATGGQGYAQFEPPGKGTISDREALEGINKIRNSIVGLQSINWSEHIYPLVSLLDRAGVDGLEYPKARANFGTCLDQRNEAIALLRDITASYAPKSEPSLKVRAFLKRCGEEVSDGR